jgi:predicted alpha/beta hydrolase
MLGWERIEAIDGETKDFYIRQLWDAKGSAEIELMKPAGLGAYGAICGWTLARAHARSGDAVTISSYLGKNDSFDQAMVAFGETYADQNERDYQALREAARKGRIVVYNDFGEPQQA